MTFVIPPQSTKKHQQFNKNDLSGTIYSSKNINLDEEGYIKLAEPTFAQFTTDDDVDFDSSDAMFPMENELFINSDNVFSCRMDYQGVQSHGTDTTPPTPNVEEDLVFFNQTEVVSDGRYIYYRSASTAWTPITMLPTTPSTPGVLTVWEAENSLVFGSGQTIKFVNTSWAINATILTIPNEYQVSSLVANGSQLYIATRSNSGGEAKLFVVNTIATSADNMYGCGTFEIASIKTFKSSIVAIDSLGRILRFTGGGFEIIASLPVYITSEVWADANNDYSVVSNRSLFVDGDLIYVNIYSRLE